METIKHCSYCGDWFQCRDHVTPSSWLRVYRTYRLDETVTCCNQCNSLAGNFMAFDITEKACYLIERYLKKYQRVLQLPEWNPDDIQELKGTLRMRIEANQNLKELINIKLDNLRLVASGYQPIPIHTDALVNEMIRDEMHRQAIKQGVIT